MTKWLCSLGWNVLLKRQIGWESCSGSERQLSTTPSSLSDIIWTKQQRSQVAQTHNSSYFSPLWLSLRCLDLTSRLCMHRSVAYMNGIFTRRRQRSCFNTCLHVLLFLTGDFCQAALKTHLHHAASTSCCHDINHDASWRWWQAAWVREAVWLTSHSLGIW